MLQSSLRTLVLAAALLPFAAGRADAQPDRWLSEVVPNPPRGRIGIQVEPMSEQLREYFQAPPDRGLLVSTVEEDRPAARAGLRAGDVIVEAAGAPMSEPLDLRKAVARVPEGKALRLVLVRDGAPLEVTVYPEGMPTPWVDPEYWSEWLQRGLRQGSEQLRQQLEDMEKRLEELERRFDEKQRGESEQERT